MWDYITFTLDATINFIRHDGSPLALLMALAALLRVRRVQEEIEKHLPKRLRRADRLARIESKIDVLMSKVDALMAERGILWNAESNVSAANTHRRISVFLRFSFIKFIAQFVGRFTISKSRRKNTMRSYLKKLGSRKFQTYLVFTICNIATAYLTWTEMVDVDTVIEGWMPMINGVAQLIAGAVYTWVEGKVDKANAVAYSDSGAAE